MAIEPVLFPDLEGPEFVRSSEVADVADLVLDRHGRAGGIGALKATREALVDGAISIAYLLNTKPFDPLKDDVTHDAIAKCVKAPALWHDVTGLHGAIWIRSYFWDQFDEKARAGVVLHELLHLQVAEDEDGQVKLRLRKHDVEEFIHVVRHYGAYVPGRKALVEAYGLWEQDGGDPPKPKAVR